jgi:hypothetical protein
VVVTVVAVAKLAKIQARTRRAGFLNKLFKSFILLEEGICCLNDEKKGEIY